MRRAWIAVLAVTALAAPGTAFAHGDDGSPSSEKNRSKACKALRAQLGADLFRDIYGRNRGKRNAHGKCVSRHRRVFKKLVAQAIEECKAQRRVFRHCVKQRLQALLAERRAAFEAAAKACDAERSADVNEFVETYGRGQRKRHAFLGCVVQKLRASEAAKPA
jgi:hypothetical protein